jgi:TRAP-type C4-dicarboxylate transport system permease small subunit
MHKFIKAAEQLTISIAALCVVLIMLIVSADAIGRYVFGEPLQWAYDVVSYYLEVGALYLALSATYSHGDHIAIDVFKRSLNERAQAWLDLGTTIVGVLVFTLIAYCAAISTLDSFERNEMIPGVVLWPVWLSYAAIPIGSALLVLRLMHHSYMLITSSSDQFVTRDRESWE